MLNAEAAPAASQECVYDTTPDPDYYEKKLYTYPYHFLNISLCLSCKIQSINSLSKTNCFINCGLSFSSLLDDSCLILDSFSIFSCDN